MFVNCLRLLSGSHSFIRGIFARGSALSENSEISRHGDNIVASVAILYKLPAYSGRIGLC